MKNGPVAKFSRIVLSIILMLMMGLGATAAEIHPVDAFDVECESTGLAAQIVDLESHDSQDKPGHSHHTNNCGSCHFHVVGQKSADLVMSPVPDISVWPDRGNGAPYPEPVGLYRPPRA